MRTRTLSDGDILRVTHNRLDASLEGTVFKADDGVLDIMWDAPVSGLHMRAFAEPDPDLRAIKLMFADSLSPFIITKERNSHTLNINIETTDDYGHY